MKTKLVEMHGQVVRVTICPAMHAWAPTVAQLQEKLTDPSHKVKRKRRRKRWIVGGLNTGPR